MCTMIDTQKSAWSKMKQRAKNQKVFVFSEIEKMSPEREKKYKKRISYLTIMKTAQYGLFLTVLLVILVVQIGLCLSKYFSEPTFISSWIADQKDAEFPEITICCEGCGYKEDILEQYGFNKGSDYRGTKNHTWQAANNEISSKELFNMATYSADQLIKSVYIRTIRGNSDDKYGFYAKPGESDSVALWSTQYHRSFGRCHTFFPAEDLQKLGVYYMKIYGYENIKVYLHHPGQFLDLSGRMGYKIYKNDKIQMQVTWLYASMLDENKKTVKKGFKCSRVEKYNDCMYRKLYERMVRETKDSCTVPYLPKNDKICSSSEDRDTAFNIHYNRVTNQDGDCSNPCDFLILNLGGQNRAEISTNTSLVYFYFQSRTSINEESLLYTPLSLFAEIGGYVGLLMGFSIFHLADLCSALMDRKINKYKKLIEEQEDDPTKKADQ